MATTKDDADILIIGSGASAGPFAWYLSKVPGLKIVCLEQGDWVTRPDGTEPEEQRRRLTSPPPPREGVKYFANGYPYDYSQSYWQPILGTRVRGGTVHYGAVWARLHVSDFVVRSLTGLGDDWPIRYWDLEPFYDLNDSTVGVSGVAGNPLQPRRSNELQPPPKLNLGAELLSRGFKKRGWHWWPSERAVITMPHGGRSSCRNDGRSCPPAAMNRADVVHWPEAIRNGVILKTRARVREILVNKRGLAEGALYYDADGRLQTQKARVVVMACNAIGTPRLLLNSKSSRFPNGLANSSGQVGKNLMGHPMADVVGLFDDEDGAGSGTNGLISEQFYESDPNRGFVGGSWWMSGGASGPIAAALGTPPASAATVIPAAFETSGPARMANAVPWGAAHHAAYQERYKRSVSLLLLAHELPDEANRVELHPTLTDDTGIPAPKLIYRRGEHTKKAIAFGLERAKEVVEAAGATKVVLSENNHEAPGHFAAAPGHYMGTARMGDNPERFVVDKWCRAHDVKNLFIIDGSVFTTSGACTPTSTIQAIALRTADYIKQQRRTLLT